MSGINWTATFIDRSNLVFAKCVRPSGIYIQQGSIQNPVKDLRWCFEIFWKKIHLRCLTVF